MMKRFAIRAVCMLLGAVCVVGSTARAASTTTLRTMAFNARYAGTNNTLFGENGWYHLNVPADARRFKAEQVIADFAPDILGTQELLDFQLNDLLTQTPGGILTDYDYYGVGRNDGDDSGEYAAIFYRRDRFSQLDQGTFWLSITPNRPGTKHPDAGAVRIASWVVLDDHESRQQLFVLNTHLDNSSSTARSFAAELIRNRLRRLAGDLPILLTGDLNATESSDVLATLLDGNQPADRPLLDAYREVHPVRQNNERTFHGFGGGTSGSRIDFVLHSAELTPYDAAIIRTTYDGRYPSDHYPVTAEFTLLVVPEPATLALALLGGCGLMAARAAARRRRA